MEIDTLKKWECMYLLLQVENFVSNLSFFLFPQFSSTPKNLKNNLAKPTATNMKHPNKSAWSCSLTLDMCTLFNQLSFWHHDPTGWKTPSVWDGKTVSIKETHFLTLVWRTFCFWHRVRSNTVYNLLNLKTHTNENCIWNIFTHSKYFTLSVLEKTETGQ